MPPRTKRRVTKAKPPAKRRTGALRGKPNPSDETKLSPGQRRRTAAPYSGPATPSHPMSSGRPSDRTARADDEGRFKDFFGDEDWSSWEQAFRFAEDFGIRDVADVTAFSNGSNDGDPWIAVMLLDDGRWAWLSAGCDYTGWSCQAWGESAITDSLVDLMLGYVGDENAQRLGMDMPDRPRTSRSPGPKPPPSSGKRSSKHTSSGPATRPSPQHEQVASVTMYPHNRRERIGVMAKIANDLTRTLAGSHPHLDKDILIVPDDDAGSVGVFFRGDAELTKLVRQFFKADLKRAGFL
jgi:hypothetical protein